MTDQKVTLELSIEQAAMIHTLADRTLPTLYAMGDRLTAASPVIGRIFRREADGWREIRDLLESAVPDFRDGRLADEAEADLHNPPTNPAA